MSSLYLENLEEYVIDSKKIVSYKWLSRDLAVPYDVAKKMLYAFAQEKGNRVNAIYLIAGTNTKTNMHEFRLVHQQNIEKAKEEFKPITSLHIYSVQSANVKDSNEIWTENYQQVVELARSGKSDQFIDNRYSSIVFDAVFFRDSKQTIPDIKPQIQNNHNKTTSKAEVKEKKDNSTIERLESGNTNYSTEAKKTKTPAKSTFEQYFTKKSTSDAKQTEAAEKDKKTKRTS